MRSFFLTAIFVAAHAEPVLTSASVLVVDQKSGKVLFKKNPRQIRPIASISKLMTAIVVLSSRKSLASYIKISVADVDRLKWSHSRLPVGTLLRKSTLLRLALMSSENRAAAALSRDYPGGRQKFILGMNAQAVALGMHRTHFRDPTGLSPENTSSACDLQKLIRAADRFQIIKKYTVATQRTILNGALVYRNSNPLVRAGKWDIRLQKTGFINEAGHGLVMETMIRGRSVAMVILGAPDSGGHVKDAKTIKNWLEQSRSQPGAPHYDQLCD